MQSRGRPAQGNGDAGWTKREGLEASRLWVVFAVSMLLIFSRLPGALLYPQFFAEDGWVWYQQAYNLHWWHALMMPQAGYMQTLPRLVAALTMLVPLTWAPLTMNLAGAAVQALPVVALMSRRATPWGKLSTRTLMAVVYLAIPDAAEIHIVLTNAMWHLAVLQAVLAFSVPPRTRAGQGMDVALFAIGGVSGPFCLLLWPSVAIWWWVRRQRWTLAVLGLMSVGAMAQVWVILHSVRNAALPLGTTPQLLARLVSGDIFLNSIADQHGASRPEAVILAVLLFGLLVLAFAWRSAPLAARLYFVFAVLATAAGLHDPLVYGTTPRWQAIETVTWLRYWYYPSLMFLWAAVVCASQSSWKWVRVGGWTILLVLALQDVRHWLLPGWPHGQLREYAAKFEAAKPGEHVFFPIYPDERRMELIKH